MGQTAPSTSTDFFLSRGCVIFLTTDHTITAVTTEEKKEKKSVLCKELFDTFDNRCDVLRAVVCDSSSVFLLRGCVILCVRGCVILVCSEFA